MKKNSICLTGAKIAAIFCLLLAFAGPAQSAPYPESSYYSLYQQPKTYTYTDVAGATKNQTRVGYRYQNDYTDSIVACGTENDSTCINGIMNTTKTLRALYPGKITAFKVYVPPGSTSVSLMSHVAQSATTKYVTFARLGSPPQVDAAFVPTDVEYANLSITGFTLNQLRSGDCIGKNSAGYLFIADDSGLSVATESAGGWLYVVVKVISGSIIDNVYSNQVNLGTPSTAGTFLGWHTEKTQNNTWGTLNEDSYIGTPTATPTPTSTPVPTATPVPGATPTPVPTPSTGCDMYTCPSGNCVNGQCVSVAPTPTPSSGCDPLACLFAGGVCVNNVCVTGNPTATPTPTPSPTTPVALELTAKPLAQLSVETKTCQNVDLTNLQVVLKTDSLPSGNVGFYSALCFLDSQTSLFYFAQKDILQKDVFIYTDLNAIKPNAYGMFPSDGSWENNAFKSLFLQLSGVKCSDLENSGIYFLQGYAPGGDFSQFQGAVFTFVK